MSELTLTFLPDEEDRVSPVETYPLQDALGRLPESRTLVTVVPGAIPGGVAGSSLPLIEQIVTAVPWTVVAASGTAIAHAASRIVCEWIRAESSRTVRVDYPDGTSVEITGSGADVNEVAKILARRPELENRAH